jgi:ferredoxin
MKVAVRYFSGTGNTARACSLLEEEFHSAQWDVDLRELRTGQDTEYEGIEGADLLFLAFPALGFAPPTVVRKWIARFPKTHKTPAAILCIGGASFVRGLYIPGWGGAAPFQAARILAHRGCTLSGISEASYPDNWIQVSAPPDKEKSDAIRKLNDPAVRTFAKAVIAHADGKTEAPILRRRRLPMLVMGLISFLFGVYGKKILGRIFIANDTCTSCGLCARACPALAIRMKRGKPIWGSRCVACNRCINLCPSRSIVTSNILLASHLFIFIAFFALAIAFPLPAELITPARGGLRIVAFILLAILQFWPISFALRTLSKARRFRKAFSASFMSDFPRYLAPGFVIEGKNT